jgi:hypothetical protein
MITSADEFLRLRTSLDPADYRRAASEAAPLAVWHEMLRRFPEMRGWVAHNKSVPVAVLEELAADQDARVRFVVASKRSLPERLQLTLAGDPDYGVRDRIAWNAKATRKALEMLACDPEPAIRRRAKERLDRGEYS